MKVWVGFPSAHTVVAMAMLAGCFEADIPATAPPGGSANTGNNDGVGGDGQGQFQGLLHHRSCEQALRPEVTASIGSRRFELDTKQQNAWTRVDCSSVSSLIRCSEDAPCSADSRCIYPVPGAQGYCIFAFDGMAPPTSYGAGQCVEHLTPDQHAALCCETSVAVDCTSWPPTTRQGPGRICTDHAHCEPGLVCASTGRTYGRCACPEAAHFRISNAPWCGTQSGLAAWGKPALALPVGACAAGVTEGYVQEVLATFTPEVYRHHDIVVEQDPEGYLYAMFSEPDALHIFSDRMLDWPSIEPNPSPSDLLHWILPWPAVAPLAAAGERPRFALDFAPDGSPHLAYLSASEHGRGGTVFVVHAAGGRWEVTSFIVSDAFDLLLHVGADGRRLVVISSPAMGRMAVETDRGFYVAALPGGGSHEAIVSWPEGQSRVVFYDSGPDYKGGLVDPASGSVTTLETNPIAAVVAGTELAVLSAQATESALFIQRIATDGSAVRIPVWSRAIAHRSGSDLRPSSLALDASLEPYVVHPVPEGLALTRRGQTGEWQTTTLVADRGTPKAVIDRAGNLQVFLAVDADWDRYSDQIRRVRRGACN